MISADITVLGAGSYGTALAIAIARNGHSTLLWAHEAELVEQMQQQSSNPVFLPDVPFPETLKVTNDLKAAVQASKNILLVAPSFVFGSVLERAKPYLREDSQIAWATKGLEPETGRLLQDVAAEILPSHIPLAVISGPTFAMEVAKGLPTAISLASTSDAFADTMSNLLRCERSFRVYKNDDFRGLQLGGAVKNVIAIGAGLSDGLGFGANARTALITRGLKELSRLGLAVGAKPETFMGMAGLGDLVLTCTDNQSRNRRFGIALGKGVEIKQAEKDIGQVVEGYRNAKEVYVLSQRMKVEMPICEQIYQVLYEGKDPKAAALALISRSPKQE